MCIDPISLSALFLGTAAVEATTTTAAVAATAGLIGSGGSLSLASVAGLAGTALTSIGSLVSGSQTKAAADYNATVEKQRALDAQRRGSIAEGEQRLKTQQIIGAQRVAMGASGIVPDEGSFGDLLAQSAAFGERDAQRIRQNADREAAGFRSQAAIDQYQGANAQQAGIFKGATSLLTGAFNLLKPDPWYRSLQTT